MPRRVLSAVDANGVHSLSAGTHIEVGRLLHQQYMSPCRRRCHAISAKTLTVVVITIQRCASTTLSFVQVPPACRHMRVAVVCVYIAWCGVLQLLQEISLLKESIKERDAALLDLRMENADLQLKADQVPHG